MATTPTATPTESGTCTEPQGTTSAAARVQARPGKKQKLAATDKKPRPGKKQKLAATDKKPKFHPTGEKRGYRGKCEGGLTLLVEDFCEQSECPHLMVVHMNKKGALFSMHGEALELACGKSLHEFLKKSVQKGNTIVRFRHEDSGMQNGVHADMLQGMMDDAEEKDEELDDDSFAEEVHDIVDALAERFEFVDNCSKTCCQPVDLHLLVYRCD
jgi:hypothetical protein